MHGIDLWVFDQSFEIRVALLHPERIANEVQFLLRALANCSQDRVWMTLINGDKLCPESKADNRYVELFLHRKERYREDYSGNATC